MAGPKPRLTDEEVARPFRGGLADRYPPVLSPEQLADLVGLSVTFGAFLARRRVAKLHQVTASVFDAWRAERRAVRHARTVYTESVIVKQLFAWAVSRRLIPDSPLKGVRLNKPFARPKPGPSLDQVNAILAAAEPRCRTG